MAYPGDIDAGGRYSREHSSAEADILTPRPGHTQQPIGSGVGTPQSNNKLGGDTVLPNSRQDA